MLTVQLLDWTLRADASATRDLYRAQRVELRPECCTSCENLAQLIAEDRAFPSAFRTVLDALGIDHTKAVEAIETSEAPDGRRLYSGYFYFVGEILAGGDAYEPLSVGGFQINLRPFAERFDVGVTREISFHDTAFRGASPLLQLEWWAELPWVLATAPPS